MRCLDGSHSLRPFEIADRAITVRAAAAVGHATNLNQQAAVPLVAFNSVITGRLSDTAGH
jgi:hypothetical protein